MAFSTVNLKEKCETFSSVARERVSKKKLPSNIPNNVNDIQRIPTWKKFVISIKDAGPRGVSIGARFAIRLGTPSGYALTRLIKLKCSRKKSHISPLHLLISPSSGVDIFGASDKTWNMKGRRKLLIRKCGPSQRNTSSVSGRRIK